MKNYYLDKDKIVVTNLCEFNITHILECGQVFRFKKENDIYIVFSGNKRAEIKTFEDRAEIYTKNTDYFVNYFDLDTDYTKIKNKLAKYKVLKPMLSMAYGIRILKQNPIEMIISFIISANNNIKRIQIIIENICKKFGTLIRENEYYAFPTLNELLKASIEDFKECGAGYRAKYLYNVVRELQYFDINEIYKLESEKAVDKLLTLSGVGPKVADCILLFGFNKQDCFPVDTWIKKVYNEYFALNKTENVKQIRKELVNIFTNLSGYAQQYLFYYKRSLEK